MHEQINQQARDSIAKRPSQSAVGLIVGLLLSLMEKLSSIVYTVCPNRGFFFFFEAQLHKQCFLMRGQPLATTSYAPHKFGSDKPNVIWGGASR